MKSHPIINANEITEVSFIIQGEINYETTSQTIENIRRFFPYAEIVLSTYEGSDISGLDYDKIVFVEDPGFYYYDDQVESKKNNINRQILTTAVGLKAATRKYAFKLRSDFVLTGTGFLEYFNKFTQTDPEYRVFEHKVLSCVFFARDPRGENSLPFHPSDIAFFGLRTDLLNLFDIPFMTEEESTLYKFKDVCYCKYVPEQHIWVNCLLKNGKDINFKHQRDISEEIAVATEKYAVSNFIYLDWVQFNLLPPERLTKFSNNDFHDVITHVEWQQLYKKYLDAELIVPNKDSLRDFLEKQIVVLKWYKFIAKFCTMFLIGKRLKVFRRKKRNEILQYLMENICLPKQ